jgi:exonuclease SbcC
MMHFFKHKWQHRDPRVRRQAIKALDSAETGILCQIAREDESPDIRRLALRRLVDLDLLQQLSKEDGDSQTCQLAQSCLSELLAGTREASPELSVRMDFIARHPETGLLEFVALNGVETELRRSAQDRITEQTMLRNFAVNDAVLANRLAALERITDTSILETVIQQTHKQDKQIHRQSQARLDAIREAQERPARIKAECEQICTDLETMTHEDKWQEALDKLPPLVDRWQAIADEAGPEFLTRYEAAHAAAMKASAAYREARETEQREWAATQVRRQALLAEVAQRKAQLPDKQALSEDTETEYLAELESWQNAWNQAGDLPASQAQALDEQFSQDINAIRRQLEASRYERQMQQDMESLLVAAEKILNSKQPVTEKQVKSLEKRRKQRDWPTDSARLAKDLQRFKKIDKQLRQRLIHQRDLRTEKLEKLPGMLDQLEALLNKKIIREAAPLHDRINSSINHLKTLGVTDKELGRYTRQLHDLTPQLRELQSWRSWGGDEALERLCKEIESLIGSDTNPADLAAEIRRLRNEWAQLRSDGSAAVKTLRKRFDKAAREAYKPCEIFFKQQAAERSNHLEVKQALLERLEAYLAEVDWSHIDWKAAVKFQRQLSNDWRQAGPVDRRKNKEIEAQYHDAIKVLNEHLATERKHNLQQRKALIEQVRGLTNHEDIRNAIEECKRLQTRWQTTVPGKRKQENTLWEEFREACDAVFARRKQQQHAHHELEKQNKAQKQQLCAQLEELTRSTTADLAEAERQMHALVDQWQQAGPIAKRDQPALEKRFDKARDAFQAHAAALHEAAAQEQLALLRKKAGCCTQAEQLLEHPDPAEVGSKLEDLDINWNETPSLEDSTTEKTIQQRYQKLKKALLAGDEQRDRLLNELQSNLEHRKELCLRMEILCGAESPAEEQQARMKFQANRLAEAIGHGVDDPVGKMTDLEREWYLSAGASPGDEKSLQQRFEKARKTAG